MSTATGIRSARAVLATLLPLLLLQTAAAADENLDFFERKIRPVLVERCYECHSAGAKELQGGLLLDTRDGVRRGGDSGPAVVPGDAAASRLLKALRYQDDLEMPPDGKLGDDVVRDFETWIRAGAIDPREKPSDQPQPEKRKLDPAELAKAKQHWSFQRPTIKELPTLKQLDWPQGRIDAFILARLEAADLEPSAAADRRTLLRRITFDLIGLPPTPDETEAFLADQSPDAYQRVVDRLLTSPHYGERWARLWLDIARYGEDQAHIVGDDRSLCYPNAYLYRDWVIKALSDDIPYDRFIKLQLAADLTEPADSPHKAALGFIGLGPKYYDRRKIEVMADEWEDRVDVVTRGLLGLTVACARCHDHKFDPIATDDYYALAGVFASTDMFNQPLDDKRDKNDRGQAKKPDDAMHVIREGDLKNLNVFIRGKPDNKGPVVERRFLTVLCDEPPSPFSSGSGRRELAEAIVHPRSPLTARVLVSRIWTALTGHPLVATPSNFGALGERPTHPELLDDVAVRFVESGSSLKSLHREIAVSSTYQQSSSEASPRNPKSKIENPKSLDPENRLLARMNRRRLPVEAWRDALLAAAGQLEPRIGGSSIDPANPEATRRTVYSAVRRLELNRMLSLFDYPDPNLHADRRVETTTPLQKLFVLNSPLVVDLAQKLSDRLAKENTDPRDRITRAYQLLYSRPPAEQEVALGITYLGNPQESQSRWPSYLHVLIAASEAMFVD